jgi:Kef-type K+ transport system membrane component KefB
MYVVFRPALQLSNAVHTSPNHIPRRAQNVKHLAELGVVFLLFNIGLELSLDRLQSMAKYVFGMGSLQVGVRTLSCKFIDLPLWLSRFELLHEIR